MASPERILVVADLHLTRHTPAAVGMDLDGLLAAHPATHVVVAGDLFDLSIEPHPRGRDHAIAAVLGAQPRVREALARHLDTGGSLCLLAGNHDIDLAEPRQREAVARALRLDGGRTVDGAEPVAGCARPGALTVAPWFTRLGPVHVEHGHVYDPDNVPEHPLVVGEPSLGAHFGRTFLVPTGAHDFLHGNDSTPGKLFLRAFTRYRWRGPHVVLRYFLAAFGALARSGPWYRAAGECALGRAREPGFAVDGGIDRTTLARLLALAAQPTLRSFRATFARTYLDRSLPTAALLGGVALFAAGRRKLGLSVTATAGAALAASLLRGHDRYQGSVAERLRVAAEHVADTGARLVVFGHTHRPHVGARYANPGSYAFPQGDDAAGRPFLDVEIHGDTVSPRLRRWPPPR